MHNGAHARILHELRPLHDVASTCGCCAHVCLSLPRVGACLLYAIQYVYHLADVACSINDPNGEHIIKLSLPLRHCMRQ